MDTENKGSFLRKRITLGLALSWIFGLLSGFIGIISLLAISEYITGIIFVLVALILLPPVGGFTKKRFNLSLPGWLKLISIVALVSLLHLYTASDTTLTDEGGSGVANTEVNVQLQDTHENVQVVVQSNENQALKLFSAEILKIEEEWFDVWYEIQERTKTESPSVVKNLLEKGFVSMQNYKERIDRIVVPDLSDNSAEKKLKSSKSDFSKAYYSGQLYFAFAQRMIASNDMKEIDSSWAGMEDMKKDMFDYKVRATQKMSEVLSQYRI